MTPPIGKTALGADNSTPKKTYFGLQKAQEQWTKSSLFTKPELKVEDPYTIPWFYSINDDTMPENYVELPKRKHMIERQQFEALTLDEQAERGFECDSNYCTYTQEEMFAECYTLLILGNCKSKNVILKYFPECLECAKEIIKETRNLPDEERIKP